VLAFLTDSVPLATAVTLIAVTRQRTQTARGLVLTTLRISATLAHLTGLVVAGPVNALLNVRRALDRAVDRLMQCRSQARQQRFPGTAGWRRSASGQNNVTPGIPRWDSSIDATSGPGLDRTPDPRAKTSPNRRRGREKPGFQDQQHPPDRKLPTAHLTGRPPTFSGASS